MAKKLAAMVATAVVTFTVILGIFFAIMLLLKESP